MFVYYYCIFIDVFSTLLSTLHTAIVQKKKKKIYTNYNLKFFNLDCK